MRLLSVGNRYPPWSAGGYERIWSAANAHLRRRGHTVRVLTTGPDPADLKEGPGEDPEVFRDLWWYWRDHAFPKLGWREVSALERHNRGVLDEHIDAAGADAILWWSMGGMSLSLLEHVRRRSIPALGIVGDDWFAYGPRVDRSRRRRLRRPRLDRCARWAFISEQLRQAAAVEAGWDVSDATVLRPGVDRERFPPAEPAPWRGKLLLSGRVEPRKGPQVAIRALAMLPDSATLTVDGPVENEYLSELRRLADELSVACRVDFVQSPAEAMAASYAAADVVLFPVLWREPWGLVPLEAMSVGRPVVATADAGGPSEYLKEGSNCLAFPAGDAQALAARVQQLAEDEDLRGRLVREGRTTVAALSEAAFHTGLERELEDLLTTREGRSREGLEPSQPEA